MVQAWDGARLESPGERLVMLTDASNVELERINALAQERRADAGELGARSVDPPDRPYGLRAGDQVIFTTALYQPGQARVENGTLGTVTEVSGDDRVSVETKGAREREVQLGSEELGELRLAYAQHLYKAQGRTVDRSFVLMGGWQTDRERAYVALTRAQERTDVYVSREDLGEQGMDAGAIERLGEAIAESRAQQASIATPVAGHGREHGPESVAGIAPEPTGGPPSEHETLFTDAFSERDARERESEVGRIMREQLDQDRDQDRDLLPPASDRG
jgi:hypothetical protein